MKALRRIGGWLGAGTPCASANRGTNPPDYAIREPAIGAALDAAMVPGRLGFVIRKRISVAARSARDGALAAGLLRRMLCDESHTALGAFGQSALLSNKDPRAAGISCM